MYPSPLPQKSEISLLYFLHVNIKKNLIYKKYQGPGLGFEDNISNSAS